MNKKGQFFLIAAVVIAGVILTMGAINIATKPAAKEQTALYDLSKEIDYESSQLIDYGVYNSNNEAEIKKQIDSFVSNYSATNPDTDIVIVYGKPGGLTSVLYTRAASGTVDISGAGLQGYNLAPIILSPEVQGSTVAVKINENSTLYFELQPGENFFIKMTKQVGEETIVAQQ